MIVWLDVSLSTFYLVCARYGMRHLIEVEEKTCKKHHVQQQISPLWHSSYRSERMNCRFLLTLHSIGNEGNRNCYTNEVCVQLIIMQMHNVKLRNNFMGWSQEWQSQILWRKYFLVTNIFKKLKRTMLASGEKKFKIS